MALAKEQIHILGPGAMGLLWASECIRQGWDVTLIHKKITNLIDSVPITVESFSSISQYQVSHTTVSTLKAPIKILFVCVKAYQVVTAFKSLKDKLADNCLIILMQNGMGSDKELLKHYPWLTKHTIVQAVTTHGVLKLSTLKIRQTGNGYCRLGFNPLFLTNPLKRQAHQKLKFLFDISLVSGWSENIEMLQWKKLIINASINPLSTILNCKNGKLLKKDNLSILSEIVNECCYIATESGQEFSSSMLLDEVILVCDQTAENNSSMLQDHLKAQRTEINYMNQYLCTQAKILKIDTPWNSSLIYILNRVNHARILKQSNRY